MAGLPHQPGRIGWIPPFFKSFHIVVVNREVSSWQFTACWKAGRSSPATDQIPPLLPPSQPCTRSPGPCRQQPGASKKYIHIKLLISEDWVLLINISVLNYLLATTRCTALQISLAYWLAVHPFLVSRGVLTSTQAILVVAVPGCNLTCDLRSQVTVL